MQLLFKGTTEVPSVVTVSPCHPRQLSGMLPHMLHSRVKKTTMYLTGNTWTDEFFFAIVVSVSCLESAPFVHFSS
jgi:hypothetical protein